MTIEVLRRSRDADTGRWRYETGLTMAWPPDQRLPMAGELVEDQGQWWEVLQVSWPDGGRRFSIYTEERKMEF